MKLQTSRLVKVVVPMMQQESGLEARIVLESYAHHNDRIKHVWKKTGNDPITVNSGIIPIGAKPPIVDTTLQWVLSIVNIQNQDRLMDFKPCQFSVDQFHGCLQ